MLKTCFERGLNALKTFDSKQKNKKQRKTKQKKKKEKKKNKESHRP